MLDSKTDIYDRINLSAGAFATLCALTLGRLFFNFSPMSNNPSASYLTSLNDALAGVEQEILRLTDLAAKLRDAGASSSGASNGQAKAAIAKPAKAPKAASPKTRARRRSGEEIAELAKSISDFVGSKGKEGASGTEVTEKFGKLLPSIKAFVNAKLGDNKGKLKTKGAARQTRYFVE